MAWRGLAGQGNKPEYVYKLFTQFNKSGQRMKTIQFRATGQAPLLMHSDRYSNPLDPLTKKHKLLTSKRKKTDEDHENIATSEWIGAIYSDSNGVIHVPGENVESCLVAGAKLQRLGTHFKRGAMVVDSVCELEFKGKAPATELVKRIDDFSLVKSVVVNRAGIIRVRPLFREWSIVFSVAYNPDILSESDILKAADDAGAMIGLCDWRPRYGRFSVEVI